MELLAKVANKFFQLAIAASRNGGFWVSTTYRTAQIAAAEIAYCTGTTYGKALAALEQTGNKYADKYGPELYGCEGPFYWYEWLRDIQPPVADEDEYRWDVRTIARAACRAILSN